jgi:hypothetical protein
MKPESLSCSDWIEALSSFHWEIDLGTFEGARHYRAHFDRIIGPDDLEDFENGVRDAVEKDGSYVVVGEVTYWKILGSFQLRNKITWSILSFLKDPDNWQKFRAALILLAQDPSFNNFLKFQQACNQPEGFALPLTFLSFYRPLKYPMVDKFIAHWWKAYKDDCGFSEAPDFIQREEDGLIDATSQKKLKQNWDAYLAWTAFARTEAIWVLKNCGLTWRPRDVEKAIWMMQRSVQ